jgi:methylenetetrahydrofolate--tRNA-(uracil-5-)-methyltransferase
VNFGLFPPLDGVRGGRRGRKERYKGYTDRAKELWQGWLDNAKAGELTE